MPAVEILALDWECHEAPVQASKLLKSIRSAPDFGYVQVLRLNPKPTNYRIRASLVDKLWTAAEHPPGSSLGGQMKLVLVGNNLKSGINAGPSIPLEDRSFFFFFCKTRHQPRTPWPKLAYNVDWTPGSNRYAGTIFRSVCHSTPEHWQCSCRLNQETFQIPHAPTTTCTTASAPSRIEVAYRFLKHLGEETLAFRMRNGLAISSS